MDAVRQFLADEERVREMDRRVERFLVWCLGFAVIIIAVRVALGETL